MSENGNRQKYVRFQALITRDQRAFLDEDGRARYPELAAKARHLSPALRDMIDFTEANPTLFLLYLASRNELPPLA